jgi:phospholipid transport system substrate-binding protein
MEASRLVHNFYQATNGDRMRIKSALSTSLILVLLFLQPGAQADATSPTKVIKTTVDEIFSVLRIETLTSVGKWQLISKIIKDKFDFRSMSQNLLEIHWDKASTEEKRRCADYFAQYLESVYRSQIESYTNQSVRYAGESIKDEYAVVNTFIVADSDEISVSYRMRLNDGEWTVYDMQIDGESLMDSHRNVLYSIIQAEGMKGLLRELKARNLKYKND